ncbi:MAG: tetratricopeptide repeat protein [Gammaproteobacteria bacterium]|nr:tetratricopeptide repeat protein [Gammaproteobacteria bacterium]
MSDHQYVIDATIETFPQILEHSFIAPVLVNFWADSCESCKTLTPLLTTLSDQYEGRFFLANVNVDEQQLLATQFAVKDLPSVKLLKDGQVLAELTDALSEADIRAFLDKYLPPAEDERLGQAQQLFDKGEEEPAMALLKQVTDEKPDTVSSYLMLAYAQVRNSDLNAAKETLETVPENLAKTPEVASLKGRLLFTESLIGAPRLDELQQRIIDNENDSEAHYFLASYAIVRGDYESGLETLLGLMSRDPEFRDQAARKTMITIFDILGEDPLATEYRRKMSSLLH